MAVEYPFGFIVGNTDPIDSRFRFATLAERDALSVYNRYEGLTTYVDETETKYILKGGIANENWEEDSGSGGGGSRLNLLVDGSFEKGTDGWIVSDGTLLVDDQDVLKTAINSQALAASVNPFGVLRKFFDGLSPQYSDVDGELSFLIKAFHDFNIIINYIDGASNVVEVLNREIAGNSKWTFYQFPFKFVQTYGMRVFFSPIEESFPSDLILDEVFFGAKHRPIKEEGVTYLSGDEFTDGSWRTVINIDGNLEFEKRVLGNWVYAGGFSI